MQINARACGSETHEYITELRGGGEGWWTPKMQLLATVIKTTIKQMKQCITYYIKN
jgi:hypothetical protein